MTARKRLGLLIAEDEEELRILLASVLEVEGYKVFQARDGQAGVDLLQEHLDEIVVVITDLGLPIVSGLELIQKARALKPSLKIVGCSGYGRATVRDEVLNAGGDEFQPKPFIVGDLIDMLKHLLDQP